ncbi:hypothetical protein [Cohnella sp. AR92]|uniref:hypothetical protein n=1 Tax=Cohnella sp. AR92 TaxID=648716 RepID=UPI001864C747|nr:hypothetical protein [Cohnella sp. AR92]
MFRATKWISAIIIAIGMICCVWHIRDFNDGNLGLMIGIGFLVGGIEVLILGAFASLMQQTTDKAPSPSIAIAEPTAEKPV